ncbi:MAG: Crp/Fnr family transcriptional regulator [Eubacteriales bacterium]|nr:Crp/Fnr family transcriptional regulator [Eubacteriales bacterium]
MGIDTDKSAGYFPFYGRLANEQKTVLLSNLQKRRFNKGDIIHSGAEDCIGLLLVTEGQLRVYALSDEGKELTLYRLFERDMCLFSASCIMASIQFEVMISAERDTQTLIVPALVYKQLMTDSAAVANYTNELMASRFTEVMWLIDQIQNKKLDSRLAAFLIEESYLTSDNVLSITHEAIANHLGSIREVITRMLKYFQEEGLVKLGRGYINLTDTVRLTDMAKNSLK